MVWFGKKDNNQVPVGSYIKAADSVSRPMAIAIGLVIFFVGAAVAFSLFLGGRWVYQKLTGEDKTQPAQIENSNQAKKDAKQTEDNKSQQSADTDNNSEATIAQPSEESEEPLEVGVEDEVEVSPNTGPETVPNTGPQPE